MPKIVMIDDDLSLLGMTQRFLESQGWGFRGASTAADGLQELSKEAPDIILLDVNLPDSDGMAVCSKLKADPATRNVPLVLFSGDRKTAEDILRGLGASGADGYVVKPVHLGVLKAKLEAVLRPFEKN